jgi:hypothetical protein
MVNFCWRWHGIKGGKPQSGRVRIDRKYVFLPLLYGRRFARLPVYSNLPAVLVYEYKIHH